MRWLCLLCLVTSTFLGPPLCLGAENDDEKNSADRSFDGFDGGLALPWQQIRPDVDNQSFTKNPGKLTIATQYGSIHLTGRPELARNLFLLDISDRGERDFTVTTCLEAFRPLNASNQAGLVIYNDDDNYFKFVSEYGTPGKALLNALAETDGKSQITKFKVPLESPRVWLRVVKRGNHYECSSSSDGKAFNAYADILWGDGDAKYVGILAKNGSSARARSVDAVFDFFELRDPTPEEKDDSALEERARLLGDWSVATGVRSGTPMARATLTNVTITPNLLTFAEKTRRLIGSYTIDPFVAPKRLTLFAQSGTTLTPITFAYALEGDELKLCVLPKIDVDPPTSLETEEGDDRMLLTLERAGKQE